MTACVCCSPWSSSKAWFQTRIQSIACLTESSTPGRASPSHWDSEEQSSALKEVRTQCFTSFVLVSSYSFSFFFLEVMCVCMIKRRNIHILEIILTVCLCGSSGAWGRGPVWSAFWWRICWRSQHQVVTLTRCMCKRTAQNYTQITPHIHTHTEQTCDCCVIGACPQVYVASWLPPPPLRSH